VPKSPLTDIIVVTYNAKQQLARCLGSVIRHTQGVPYQLTVVDNASSDGTSEYLKKKFARKIRLIESNRNLGFSGGANLALRKTNRPWVVLLDDDAEVTPGWLATLYDFARKNSEVGIVGAKVVSPDRRIFCAEFSLVPFGAVGHGEPDLGQRDYIKETDVLPGPCWLLPRRIIEKIGRFDERSFPRTCENLDYCMRVRLAGYKIFYYGKVKILHHNLSRHGGSWQAAINGMKFFKKWRKVRHRFPLCPLNAEDRMMVEGAKLLQKETFCPSRPMTGKWAGLSRLFSESLYRGIAYVASKHHKKAAQALRKAAAAGRSKFFDDAHEKVSFYYILSVYFARLGLIRDSKDCASRVMDLIAADENDFSPKSDTVRSRPKPLNFPLHGWRVRILTDDPDYLAVLRKFLPYYWERMPRSAARVLEISFSNRIDKAWDEKPVFLGTELISMHNSHAGIYRLIHKKKSRISIVMNRRKFFRDNWIFHVAFLGPLAFLLRFQNASLVHGALLQKNGRGVLILGEKGVGKSTLSTACLDQGFHYFSDEHPILEIGADRVQGRSFVSPIALPAVSVKKNFAGLVGKMEWSAGRRKYLLDPAKVWPGCVGKVSEISKVVFPKFKFGGNFSVKRMERDVFFQSLLEDEYLRIILQNEQKTPERSVPWRIADLLSRTARGYTIEYGARDIHRMPAILEKL